MQQSCPYCGTAMTRGWCPHCGTPAQDPGGGIIECRSKVRECIKNRAWHDAEIWALKGQQLSPSDKEFQLAELLALTEALKKLPTSQQAEVRIRELLDVFGKTERFHFQTYDLEGYRTRKRNEELANQPLSALSMIIGMIVLLAVIGLVIFLFAHPAALLKVVLVVFIGWLVISFLVS